MMPGRRDEDKDVTLYEVYRLVVELKLDHGTKLDSIEGQVRLTNGRLIKAESDVKALERDVRDLKPSPPSGVPVVTPEGESLSIKISPRMWAAIVTLISLLSVFAPMLAKWIEGLAKLQ